MFRWLNPKSRPETREDILNIGLGLAMEWGEHWRQPIQQRLANRCPSLTPEELDEYSSICQSAMRLGHDSVYSMVEQLGMEISYEQWEKEYLTSFPWVNTENLHRLFSQGMYYALK